MFDSAFHQKEINIFQIQIVLNIFLFCNGMKMLKNHTERKKAFSKLINHDEIKSCSFTHFYLKFFIHKKRSPKNVCLVEMLCNKVFTPKLPPESNFKDQ